MIVFPISTEPAITSLVLGPRNDQPLAVHEAGTGTGSLRRALGRRVANDLRDLAEELTHELEARQDARKEAGKAARICQLNEVLAALQGDDSDSALVEAGRAAYGPLFQTGPRGQIDA